ncbi:MAG: type II toxin-antitoxin system prevent-host-death family antitoxin [Bdellovibrionales bacterium]|nr:type II toxin-antitoxin system prevent-host-death family antitoxin [Bdellovibrionales bacterium]
MSKEFSTYEAKAKFSEILRMVRDGTVCTITYRGKPVAQLVPIQEEETFEDRIEKLKKEGSIRPSKINSSTLQSVESIPGALQRFLDERE